MEYYDTQVWFTHDFSYHTLLRSDQRSLIRWLSQAADGKERNLILSGSEIGWELMSEGRETLGFYTTWLASDYGGKLFAGFSVPSYCTLHDAAGDFDFMTYGGGTCWLRGYT